MKKLLCIILAALLALSLTACGETPENPTVNQIQKPAAGELTEEFVRNYPVTPEKHFKYSPCTGGVYITGYTGNDDIVVIPETIDGKTVIEVGGQVFANDSIVRGVFFPDSVKTIVGTFPNNHNFEIAICEGAEAIDDNTFFNCDNLHTVILGDSLKKLGDNAFAGCDSLKELHIGPECSFKNIDEDEAVMLFWNCDSLTIYGKTGSEVEDFCKAQNIPFVAE